MSRLMAVLLIFTAGGAFAQATHLKHFTQVDDRIYAGSKPTRDADFEFLRSKGIRYILQANFLPGLTGEERKQAERFGLNFYSVPMNASPVSPSETHVNEALRIMRTRQPIYIHCVLGRDRTGLLTGLYKIYFEAFSREKAYQFMLKQGFRGGFFLHGLKSYFDKHTARPAALADLAS